MIREDEEWLEGMSISFVDDFYTKLVKKIMVKGQNIITRNSKVKRIISEQVAFCSTPLISIRKTAWRQSLLEWEWFMSGSDNIKDLHPSVQHWWKPWANVEGEILFNYFDQFRAACGNDGRVVDQIDLLIEGIKNHPFSRRNYITTWNTADMTNPACKITNCHGSTIQAFVNLDNSLDLVTYQRSVDVICGLPHNLFQYWAFLHWLAYRGGRKVGNFIWIGGDVHIYEEHFLLAEEIISRVGECGPTPKLIYKPTSDDFKADDFSLDGEYKSIIDKKAKMIV